MSPTGRFLALCITLLTALSVGAAAAVLWWSGLGWEAVPFAVAAGALVGAVLQRMVVLGSAEPVAPPPVPRDATV